MSLSIEVRHRSDDAGIPDDRGVALPPLAEPASATHRLVHAVDIVGALDAALLYESLSLLVRRHTALRTRFAHADGVLVARITEEPVFDFESADLDGQDVGAAIEAERRRAFAPADAPLFAVRLLRCAASHHVLLLSAHRLVLDRDSIDVLLREFGQLYEARGSAVVAGLDATPPSPTSHDAASAATSIAFWRGQLADALPLLAFPTDFPRPARLQGRRDMVVLPLSPDIVERIRTLGAQHSIELEDFFIAAFQVFLFRYSGQQDVVIGVPYSHRATPQAQAAVGNLTAVLPLRQPIDAGEPFAELVKRNRRSMAEAAAHRSCSFGAICDAVLDEISPSHAPVFQHGVSFVRTAGTVIGLLGAEARATPCPEPIGSGDTGLTVIDGPAGMRICIEYQICLFEREGVERQARNFSTLVESICVDSAAAVGQLELLHPLERAFIASSLDRCGTPFKPRFPGVHVGFEQQAAKTPDAPALRCGDASLTYAQLDSRANAIAQHLRRRGVGAGDLVGVCTGRTLDMIAAVIGVLKLGAAYVPMDVKFPALRLESIAHESNLRFMLCDARGQGLVKLDGLQEVFLPDVDDAPVPPEPVAIDGDSLCHVIFTSGSTGKPKGVMARHHNALAFLEWIWSTYSVEELGVVLCCSSLCFDLTVFEIWGPLTVGGTVVVVENPASLVQQAVPGLTLLNTVPTALRLIVDERALPATTKTINVCGEPLDAQLVNDLFLNYPDVVFYNTYGPTEDTAYSTFFRMTGPRDEDPPIGQPLVHEYGRVVDAQGQLVPVGVVGELCMGGAGVARGYLNRPEQTAERFITSRNYVGEPSREYRTGDFVRLRSDGQLHFVGRRDDQIKLRGFRIDLGDVVGALGQIDGVTDARVLVRRHKTGDVLVAYVSHADMPAGQRSHAALSPYVEARTRDRLPAYMVPSFFLLFDKLPLNENGKVDRHALAAMAFDAGLPSAVAAPLQGDEKVIAEIWSSILKVEGLSRDDDFFLVGGNSLLAVRMVSRVNKVFGTSVPSHVVFTERSITAFAAQLRGAAGDDAVPLVRVDPGQGIVPTYPQLAMLMDPMKTSFNLCSAMHVRGPIDVDGLRRSLRALVMRHDALRTGFAMDGAGVRLRIADDVPDILTTLDLAGADERRVAAEIDAEWRRPFDLHEGPPARALLIELSPDHHVFVFSIHHVVTDEWSTNILKKDIARLYAIELQPARASPEPLPIRYSDYAHWQGLLHATDDYERHLAYWTGEFAGIAASAPFPMAGEAVPECIVEHVRLEPPARMTSQLQVCAASEGRTAYATLMAALQLALAEYSGLDQQLVWSPVARRARPEIEESIGLYTNLSIIVARANPSLGMREFLAQVDHKVGLARVHGDVSALTAVMGDPSAMPSRPMIGLNFIDLPNACEWEFAGASVEPIELRLQDEADLCVLELTVRLGQGAMDFTLAYNTSAFDAKSVDRIVASLWAAVEAFAEAPAATVGEFMRSRSASTDAPATAGF